jgi:hypothetical protein
MSIVQARCADFDGDNTDEIVVLVRSKKAGSQSSVEGLYYYRPVDSLIRGEFEKSKILDGSIASFVAEDFQLRDKIVRTILHNIVLIREINNGFKYLGFNNRIICC